MQGVMNRGRFVRGAMAVLAFGLMAGGALGGPPFADKSEDGKRLVVPSELASKGTAYHAILAGREQVYFESNAPLEKIKGNSKAVVGYAVVDGGIEGFRGGEWHLPVASMRTGIDLRDEHLANSSWLNAKKYPDIVVQIEKLEDVSLKKEGRGFLTYGATLVGELTMHGQTRAIRLPGSTITMLEASERTAKIAPGDLMAIRAEMAVSLSEHGVENVAVSNEKVSDTIEIDVSLYLSTGG